MVKFNVLVVDDATIIREFIRRGITASIPNVVVHEALNPIQAQHILEKKPIDIILCDWEMPKMTGHEFLLWLRKDERFRDIPFVMVTSVVEKTKVVNALQAGVDGYITKPFTIDILIGKIHDALARHGKSIEYAPRTSASSAVPFADSVAILTGAFRKEGDDKTKEHHDAKEAPKPAEAKSPRNPLMRLNAQLLYGGHTVRCLLQKLDLEGTTAVMPVMAHDEVCPAVADAVLFTVALDASHLLAKDIKAVVTTIETVDSRNETRFIRLTLRFTDEDLKKHEDLSHIISAF